MSAKLCSTIFVWFYGVCKTRIVTNLYMEDIKTHIICKSQARSNIQYSHSRARCTRVSWFIRLSDFVECVCSVNNYIWLHYIYSTSRPVIRSPFWVWNSMCEYIENKGRELICKSNPYDHHCLSIYSYSPRKRDQFQQISRCVAQPELLSGVAGCLDGWRLVSTKLVFGLVFDCTLRRSSYTASEWRICLYIYIYVFTRHDRG